MEEAEGHEGTKDTKKREMIATMRSSCSFPFVSFVPS